jgi:hypothetical protein
LHRVAQADIASAKLSASAWTSVVSVHQDDVALGIEEQGTELSTRTVACVREREALLDTDTDVFLFHETKLSPKRVTPSYTAAAKISVME